MPDTLTCPHGHRWQHGTGQGAAADGAPLACPECGAAPTLEGLGAPLDVAAAVSRLRDELTRAAGANLAGLILYGGLARGRYHPGTSDINVVVLLRDVSAAALSAVAPPLRAAWRALRVEPLVLAPAEVGPAAEDFPTKFLDIKAHHVVLAGEDPFRELAVPRELIRLRAEQTLRNLALRLRRRYVTSADDPAGLAQALVGISRPLALELAALLRLAGKEVPAEDRTAAVFEAAAESFDLDREALAQVAALRRGAAAGKDLAGLYQRVLGILSRAADRAHQMKESPP